MTLAKSPYGSPCNSCGLCCREELCPLAQLVFPDQVAPCPALETEADDRQVCGLIAHPGSYAPVRTSIFGVDAMREAAMDGVGYGIGCDSQVEDELDVNPPPEFAARLAKMRRGFSAAKRTRILRLWGSGGVRW